MYCIDGLAAEVQELTNLVNSSTKPLRPTEWNSAESES